MTNPRLLMTFCNDDYIRHRAKNLVRKRCCHPSSSCQQQQQYREVAHYTTRNNFRIEKNGNQVVVPPHFVRCYQKSSSQSFSSSLITPRQNRNKMAHLERLKKKARELVDERRHPPGSFQKLQYNQAKEVLDYFQRGKVHDVDCVTVSLQLLERLIAEMSIRTDEMVQRWLCDPRYFTPLFNIWKKAAMLHMDVITPRGLLIKLHTMTIKFPDFKFNIYAAGIILDVLVKQAKPEKAPAEAMDLFHYIKQEATRTQNADLSPNEYMYRRLLQIWAASGLPEAPDKMESILESMRRDLIPPNVVSYTVLLNLWARCGAVDKIAKVLETMKSEGIQPDIMCLSRALHGFAQAGKTEEAQRIVTEMMALDFNSEKHKSQLVGEGARKILFAYRTILGQEDVEGSFGLKEKIIKEAKELYLRAEKYVSSDEDEKRKLMGTMMDLYVRAGKQDEAEAIFNKMDLDIVKCTILIKSFGKEDAADRAAAVLKSMLRGSRVAPDVFIFNTLINAWAESSRPDSVEQAFAVLTLMETDPRAKELGIKPDTVTFNTLLKCLLTGEEKNAGTKAETIIDQMEKRFDAGEKQLKPNEISYILAAKVCLLQRDVDKGEAMLERMEKSGIYADRRNYNVILLQISKMEQVNAGERVEKILARMSEIGKEKFPPTIPDVFSYSIAMDAWINSGLKDAASRIFALYIEMTKEGVEPNDVIFNTLITFLSKQKDMDKILKAEQLLNVMRDSKTLSLKPDFRHFAPVINGWLNVNSALGAQGAERVLLRWIEQYMNSANTAGKIDPSQFDKVAKAWIRAGDPLRATKLIYHVKMLHDNKLIPDGPNPMTYGRTLVRAWKKANHPETERQLQVLEATLAEMQGNDS